MGPKYLPPSQSKMQQMPTQKILPIGGLAKIFFKVVEKNNKQRKGRALQSSIELGQKLILQNLDIVQLIGLLQHLLKRQA
jgi:hypothetical protein